MDGKRQSIGRFENLWLMHFVGLVGCVGLPASVTATAPVGVTHLECRDASVHARITWNLFFVIPYHHAQIDNVTAIDDRFHAGELTQVPGNTAEDARQRVRSEDEGFLVIHGASGYGDVPVSPVSIHRVVKKARDFLSDDQTKDLRLVTVANYKFGVLAGGVLSVLTVLYLLGVVMSLGQFTWRVFRRL